MEPLVLLDDARCEGAADARLYRAPRQVFVARRPDEVEAVLAAAEAADGHLAGYIAYEAGLALEERLQPLVAKRTGAAGPLVWLGLFDTYETIPAARMPDWLAEHARETGAIGPLAPALSPGGYIEAFARAADAIRAGDIYQVNLTLPLTGRWSGDPLGLYAVLRANGAAGYGGAVFDGSHWLLSFSPELFVSSREGQARTKPMKGTRPRSADPATDAALRAGLADSTKDKAENLMIVDLLRNDLSRVAVSGTVRVDAPFAVESYPTVHQMVSTVTATLRPDAGPLDLVRALFPCGSITGAPKIRAMEIIAELERDARGPYCGAIGRIDRRRTDAGADGTGDAAFNVAIRTLRLSVEDGGGGSAVLGIGGAIVADSQPLEEWREAMVKGNFVRALGVQEGEAGQGANRADLIEAMRFDPADGIALLELHLERMKASAAELGFAFDRHAARNQIQALCFELEEPAKVRLLLARSGSTALHCAPLSEHAPADPVRCIALPLPVSPGDWRLRHKTTDRAFYEDAAAFAHEHGAHDALLVTDNGLVTESSRANVFVERGDTLVTPPLGLGLLPGVLRRSLIEDGRAVEGEVRLDDLADGFWLGNSVRGLMRARLAS